MTRIGYARVSTEGQNLDLQLDALRKAGCAQIFREKLTGASRNRPALKKALATLEHGDTLVVWKLDRLGRSVQHLVGVIGELEARGIGFQSISDNVDTTSSSGKLLFHIIGAIAEFERSLISERTKAGLQAAKRRGRKLGRPRSLSRAQLKKAEMLRTELSVAQVAALMTVNRSTLWRALERPAAAQLRSGFACGAFAAPFVQPD